MLGKELFRVKIAGNYIRPEFIRTDDPKLLELAENLLTIYAEGKGRRREFIESLTDSCVNLMKDLKLARGILKVIQDKAEYTVPAEQNWKEIRRKAFLLSAEAIRSGNLPENMEEFHRNIMAQTGTEIPELYADLPEKELLSGTRKMFPKEVLERYNMSQVQSLLLYTEKLELEISASEDPQLLRALCRYLKFFRLLSRAEMKSKTIFLTVDGPASIFENSLKYGLQTASFFPIVCRLKNWTAACTVKYKNKKRRLLLTPENGLVCHFTNFSSYQPEEITMFADYFRKKSDFWQIDDAPGYLKGKSGELIFPDFAFRQENEVRHLELFHRWHSSQLEKRLNDCENGVFQNLLLGVDKSILKQDPAWEVRLKTSDYFQSHGFLFRDFPGMENVEKLLNHGLSCTTGQ